LPEAVLKALLKDDRLVLRRGDIYTIIAEETEGLTALSPHLWQRMSETCVGVTPRKALSDTLWAFYTTCGYMHRKFLRILEAYPWCLCHGDIRKNLETLRALPKPPLDEVSRRIWHLLEEGEPDWQELIRAVTLLSFIPWSTLAVEQGHGSLSLIHRYHPIYGDLLLALRSFLHALRAVFREPPKDKKLARLVKARARFDHKDPSKKNGASLNTQKITNAAMRTAEGAAPEEKNQARKRSFSDAAVCWKEMTPLERALGNAKARKESMEDAKALAADIEAADAAIALHERKVKEEALLAESNYRLTMGCFRATDDETRDLQERCDCPELRWTHVQDLREEAEEPPEPPTEARRKELKEREGQQGVTGDCFKFRPPWTKYLALGRDFLGRCAIEVRRDTEPREEWFLFLFAFSTASLFHDHSSRTS